MCVTHNKLYFRQIGEIMEKLRDYFKKQEELDKAIQEKHNETYESTSKKRLLALLVELGEFANETRCFKFWSYKGPSEKDVILDEYADGLHFFFSLGIPLNATDYEIKDEECLDLTSQILKVYALVSALSISYNKDNYVKAFSAYWALLKGLNFTVNDALKAYDKKLEVNYKRQESNY